MRDIVATGTVADRLVVECTSLLVTTKLEVALGTVGAGVLVVDSANFDVGDE